MEFNPGDGSGIVDEIDSLCDSDATSYRIEAKTRRANAALETIVGWVIGADGTWQFDDSNYSTLPIGVGALTEGQNAYTFSDAFLAIEEIDILDISGVYRRIKPFDPSEVGMSFEEYFGNTTSTPAKGFPTHYDKQGSTIRLGPAPTATAVTLAGGIKAHFKRTASLFATGDTAKSPGFASPFHVGVAWMAARPYCALYKKDRVGMLNGLIGDTTPQPTGLKKDIIAFYSRREKDKRDIATTKRISFR